jgi:interferon gamma-inducible protein 30
MESKLWLPTVAFLLLLKGYFLSSNFSWQEVGPSSTVFDTGEATAQQLRRVDDASKAVSVQVQISIESLCIDSKKYMLEQVIPVFSSPLSTIMDLEIIVYGNAQLNTATQTVTCQHGAAECDANIYEQCAIDNFVYPARYLPFLGCLFETLPMGHADVPYDVSYFAQCARTAALDFSTLAKCHTHDAWAMQVQSSVKTPSHDHVPWLVVDGVHVSDENDTASLANIVCVALEKKGGQTPYCDSL